MSRDESESGKAKHFTKCPLGNDYKILILLTNQYPFTTPGDTSFIENEAQALSDSFDKVFVFSSTEDGQEHVQMPSNFEYVSHLAGSGSWGKIIHSINYEVLLSFTKTIVKEPKALLNIKWVLRALRHATISVLGQTQIQAFLDKLNFSGNVFIYSFWAVSGGYVLSGDSRIGDYRIVRAHGYDLYEKRSGYLPRRKKLFSNSDLIAVISEDGKQYLENRHPELDLEKKLEVHRLGTIDHGYGAAKTDHSFIRVVSCSSVIPLKRVDLIFRLVNEMALSKPVEWVHFGHGPKAKALEKHILKVKNPNLKIVLMGHKENNEILQFYKSNYVDVFVNLSTTEGVPVSIMEAMSFGIPVLATRVGGSAEIVSEELLSGRTVDVNASIEELNLTLLGIVTNRMTYNPRKAWKLLCSSRYNSQKLIDSIQLRWQNTPCDKTNTDS